MKEWIVVECHLCCFFSSQPILSVVIAVFDFNASLNDVAPVSLMLLAVISMIIVKFIVNGCHLCVASFVFTTQIELGECCV